ncbi:MAG: PAS domain-containing sensor histidine kinase [Euryarchaeota archaeon]|nr:PAS domain-containing sensor histidine kinase [Euryarchaeota archaeon]
MPPTKEPAGVEAHGAPATVSGLSDLVESAPDAVIVADEKGVIVLANKRVEDFFGYRREELVGQPVEILVPPGLRARHKEHVREFMRDPGIRLMGERGISLHGLRKDGSEIAIDISLGPVPTTDGPRIMAVVRDFGRHQAEADRRADEIARLEGAFSTLGHELGNFLVPIKLHVHMLKLRLAPAERDLHDSLALVERNVERLARLLTDILASVRLKRGQLPVRLRAVDVNALVAESVHSYMGATREKDIQIAQDPAPAPLWVQGDPDRLHEVMFNLLTNAWKFTPRGGRVDIKVEKQGTEAVVTVRDTGRGIDPSELQRLFQPFSRAPAVKRDGVPGLGLGLYLSRGIIELHHGRIWAESKGHGRGATFRVALPISGDPA